MALSKTTTASHSNILHPTKDIQTDPSRETLIISGCDGPTERLSSFVDELLQPIAQQQKSYLKDTTHFINFLEKTKVPENTILVSIDVMSLYTNIPQQEGINIKNEPPIPTRLLQRALKLILAENYTSLSEKLRTNTWDCHGHQNDSCFHQNFHG